MGDDRPWVRQYAPGMPADLPAPNATLLDSFLDTLAARSGRPAIHYFENTLTFGDLDSRSRSIARCLRDSGIGEGDRVALYMQNDPEFVIAELAAWRVGAIIVPVNPMLRSGELHHILADSDAVVLIALAELSDQIAGALGPGTTVRLVMLIDGEDAETPEPATHMPDTSVRRWDELVECPAPAHLPEIRPSLQSLAYIAYTSGTSGKPKGVMTTHANLAYNVEVYRRWLEVDDDDRFLGGTPLFHVTGLVAGIGLCLAAGVPLVLFHRFDPAACLRQAQRWRATITIMAITAYQSLMRCPELPATDLTTLRKVYSGGAPVPVKTAGIWQEATGARMHNIYGLTETTSPSHATPLGSRGSVDPESGANSVGVPVPGAEVRVVDPVTGADVPTGETGELWIKGPMVACGYWMMPDATAESFADGWLRTGDIGKRDNEGWFYILDRAKDMINASGFKVYPREVEEILLQHPAILEAAVVGVADEYRGETVKAFVVTAGEAPSPEDVIDFCRSRLAAYKYPRQVEIVDELPKTASGKVLRRELRQHP